MKTFEKIAMQLRNSNIEDFTLKIVSYTKIDI